MTTRTRLGIDVDVDAKGVDSGVSATRRGLGSLGGFAASAGKAVGIGLAAGGAAAIKLGSMVYDSASRLQQSGGAIETVFKRNADTIDRWAKKAVESAGLSENAYEELAATLGAQLQGMGLNLDQATGKTGDLIQKGADLAATFGGTTSDAVSALGSLLRGEMDPIERYGVSIKAADVEARLAAQGLDDLEGKAAKTAKTQAILSLLNEQTADTTKAFRREADTAAGQQQRWNAAIENGKAALGEKLLPIMAETFEFLRKKGIPAFQDAAEWVGDKFGPKAKQAADFVEEDLLPALKDLKPQFSALVELVKDTADETGDLVESFGDLTGMIEEDGDLGKAIAGAVKGHFALLLGTLRFITTQANLAISAVEKLIGLLKTDGIGRGFSPFDNEGTSSGTSAESSGTSSTLVVARSGYTPPNVNVNVQGFVGDEAALARTVSSALAGQLDRLGYPSDGTVL